MKHQSEVQRDTVAQPASVGKHFDRAFSAGWQVDSDERGGGGGPLPIISSRMGTCWMVWRAAMTCWVSGGQPSGTTRPDRLVYPQVHLHRPPHRYGRPPGV
jgi:hypothetical protein